MKMNEEEALSFARQYVEATLGLTTIGSFPIPESEKDRFSIGVTCKERSFMVRILPRIEVVRLFEILKHDDLVEATLRTQNRQS